MLKKILLVLVALIAIFLIVAAFQPPEFRVERSIVVAAPPSAVFPHVNELRRWDAWSPWAKLDPNMQQTYEGPAGGVGATSGWKGNSDVGEGRMTIVESRAPDLVQVRLDFLKPFESSSISAFTFQPEGAGTRVLWSMSGEHNFISKAMCLIVSMDKMVGGQFEQGLSQLGQVAQQPIPAAP